MNISSANETLTTQEVYVLLALTDKTLHGYGIRNQVAYESESNVVLAPGTLYPLLARLVAKRLISRVPADGDSLNITYRYELAAAGARALKAEVVRLERVTGLARYKLSLSQRVLA